MVVWSEVPPQQADRREVDLPSLEQLENQRKSNRQARHHEAMKRFIFAQTEMRQAVLEHRRVASSQVQPPRLDLRQVRHDARFRARAVAEESPKALLQLSV